MFFSQAGNFSAVGKVPLQTPCGFTRFQFPIAKDARPNISNTLPMKVSQSVPNKLCRTTSYIPAFSRKNANQLGHSFLRIGVFEKRAKIQKAIPIAS